MKREPTISELLGVPYYKHDCNACVYLGSMTHMGLMADGTREPFPVDLYVCPTDSMAPTYVVRVSSREEDYTSMPQMIVEAIEPKTIDVGGENESTLSPAVVEAWRRHQQRL